ncbi:hypothetical protein SAY86_006749 [Trapa natans]|uniref:Major facilitator superfamily (MFS) profile domain-containing protein n=1 Tax=Trapa natans TaxID=22666 RepID=A0AAN7QWF7_TRANT|nr:hypothetical protein SAY86_006749 [Trapa natans]
MDRESTEEAAAAAEACLLASPEEHPEVASSASATFPVVLGTAVALWGSFVFGNAVEYQTMLSVKIELGFSSPAESGIIRDLGLSLEEYSLFGSILSVGAIVGALCCGIIADLVGRRGAMWISDVICILGWLLIGFAQKAWWLYCGRALLGCGISLLTYLVPVYISEITPKNLRGGFTALHEFVIGCSSSIAYVVGSLVNWRISALLGLIPCLVQFFGLLFIPESPRWLIKTGHDLAFKASLSRLRGKNVDVSLEAAEIKDYTIYLEQVTQKSFLDMFQRKYLHCLIVGVGLMVFQQFGGMRGILFYTARIFESAGFPGQVGSIVAAATKITVGAVGVLLLSVYGRRPLLLVRLWKCITFPFVLLLSVIVLLFVSGFCCRGVFGCSNHRVVVLASRRSFAEGAMFSFLPHRGCGVHRGI